MDSQQTPDAQEYQRSARVHLDLRRPPTPAQARMPADLDSMIVDRTDDRYLDVDLALPEGGRLHVPAIAVNFIFERPSEDTLNEIIVNQVVDGLPEAAEAVLRANLGVDQPQLHEYVREQAQKDKDDRQLLVFRGRTFGYLRVSVELRPSATDGKVLINYLSCGMVRQRRHRHPMSKFGDVVESSCDCNRPHIAWSRLCRRG